MATARLAPYPGWTVLRDRARSVWGIWRRFTPHHPISRLGIRYINRIDIPVENRPLIRLGDFLSFYPQIPPIDQARGIKNAVFEACITESARGLFREGLSLWLRHCPHLVTNKPLEPRLQPATDKMLIAPEATA